MISREFTKLNNAIFDSSDLVYVISGAVFLCCLNLLCGKGEVSGFDVVFGVFLGIGTRQVVNCLR